MSKQFADLGIQESITKALSDLKIVVPTEIQQKAIPLFRKLLDRTIPSDLTLYLYYKGLASAYDKGSLFEDAVEAYKKALIYAGTNQKMTINFAIGQLYENQVKDSSNALIYYQNYRKDLNEYLEGLIRKNETDENIDDTKKRLKYLDEHIKELTKEMSVN